MKNGDLVKFKLLQGAPIVNCASVYKISKDIACIHIDLKSKYCECDSYFYGDGDCGVYLTANKRSLNLNKKFKKKEPTRVDFVDFKEWNVFATASGRYTIGVCLVKK